MVLVLLRSFRLNVLLKTLIKRNENVAFSFAISVYFIFSPETLYIFYFFYF